GIQMAADEQRPLGLSGKSDPVVSGRIVVMLHRQAFQLSGEPFTRLQPRVSPRHTLRAVLATGEGTQLLQFHDSAFRVEGHRSSFGRNAEKIACGNWLTTR